MAAKFRGWALLAFIFLAAPAWAKEPCIGDDQTPGAICAGTFPEPSATPAAVPNVPLEVSPFLFPYYLMKGITYPVSRFGLLLDRNKYAGRTVQLAANQKQSHVFYPIMTVGSGSKFGAGLGVTLLDLWQANYDFFARAILFTDLDQRAEIAITNPEAFTAFDRAFSFGVFSTWYREFDEDFYGIGPETPQSAKTEFGLYRLRVGTQFGFEMVQNLVFSARFVFDLSDGDSGRASSPDKIQERFPPSELAGFGRKLDYVDMGFQLAHDTRQPYYYPSRGGRYSLTFHRFQLVGQGGFSFYQWDFDLEHYFTLGHPRLVLWLHNAWMFQDTTGGDQIPFYRLALLDVHSPMRGFDAGRFRDNSSVVFNVELRYPLWENVDGTVFFDSGRVFDGIHNFSFKDFRFGGGAGVRVTVRKFYQFQVDAAYAGEGVNFIFRAIQNL
ncbi:MAG TPA: BamA/TamA family outer membrane protein [bacterium]|nr:BamA/TamA family outer membrane protein [bacterium]